MLNETSPTEGIAGESGWFKIVLGFVLWAVVSIGVAGFAWLSIQDRMNGIDAWRERAVREERDGYRKACEENLMIFEQLKEHLRQQKINVPPNFTTNKPCIQPDSERGNKPKQE